MRFFQFVLVSLLLAGCASHAVSPDKEKPSPQKMVSEQNEVLMQHGSPYRWEYHELKGKSVMERTIIGTPGKTSASDTLKQDILAAFGKHCGYRPGDLVQVRTVNDSDDGSDSTDVHEVWVFHDRRTMPLTGRAAFSVFLSHAGTGETTFRVVGRCKKPGQDSSKPSAGKTR